MNDRGAAIVGIGGLGVLLSGLLGFTAYVQLGTVDHVSVTVTGSERVTSKYLVFAKGETFQNTDAMFHGKWNSSDLHGKIQPGEWNMKVYGYRIPLLSTYRNIVEATPKQ